MLAWKRHCWCLSARWGSFLLSLFSDSIIWKALQQLISHVCLVFSTGAFLFCLSLFDNDEGPGRCPPAGSGSHWGGPGPFQQQAQNVGMPPLQQPGVAARPNVAALPNMNYADLQFNNHSTINQESQQTNYIAQFCTSFNLCQDQLNSKEHEVIADACEFNRGILQEVLPQGKENDPCYVEAHARLFFFTRNRLPACCNGDPKRITANPLLRTRREQSRLGGYFEQDNPVEAKDQQPEAADDSSVHSELTSHSSGNITSYSRTSTTSSRKRSSNYKLPTMGRGKRQTTTTVSPEDELKKKKKLAEDKAIRKKLMTIDKSDGQELMVMNFVKDVAWHFNKFVPDKKREKKVAGKAHDHFFPQDGDFLLSITSEEAKQHRADWIDYWGPKITSRYNNLRTNSQRQLCTGVEMHCRPNVMTDATHWMHRINERPIPTGEMFLQIAKRDLPTKIVKDDDAGEEWEELDMSKNINTLAVHGYYHDIACK